MTIAPRILIAPDKFKGTLSAGEAAEAIAEGVLAGWPNARITLMPFADGGEGTVSAAIAAGAQTHSTVVTGPLGHDVQAQWAVLGNSAVLEMAQSSGLHLVDPSPATALMAHTEGTGEVIRAALDLGVTRIVLGVGGSATTDGGMGALRTLGARFWDERGRMVTGGGGSLGSVKRVDLSDLDPRLGIVELILCSDVSNPFVGPTGAAAVFGPQKGADPTTVMKLDAGLRRFAAVLADATGVDLVKQEWGGSGGGLAGGLYAACGARGANGVDVVADLLGLDRALATHDIVIVGEGSMDMQSTMGKTPVGVARRAGTAGIPAVAVVGRNLLGTDSLPLENIIAIASAVDQAPTHEAAVLEPARWTTAAARALVDSLNGIAVDMSLEYSRRQSR
jgi:glycerate kinase